MNLELPAMKKPQISYEILAYLVEYPQAQDTLEGIIEWWLLERRIKYETALVKKALAELIADGVLLEAKGPDSRIHYRINRSRYQKIRKLLDRKND